MNRGSQAIRAGVHLYHVASMRPRFMNRGSPILADFGEMLYGCFNEAPIHESGKSTICGTGKSLISCFNEAPIHESGK